MLANSGYISRNMKRFHSELSYSSMELFTAADIVQHSFLVQKSISPLDLELCQSFEIKNNPEERIYDASYSYSNSIINTEEKCQKIHADRHLLYTLNLDFSKRREESLKVGVDLSKCCKCLQIPHIGKILITNEYHSEKFLSFVDEACKRSGDKLKLLKWLIKFDALEESEFCKMPFPIVCCFLDCMHPGLNDSEFVKLCIRKLDLMELKYDYEPRLVENLLYQIHYERRISENVLWANDFVICCLMDPLMQYIGIILKFMNAPDFGDFFYRLLNYIFIRIWGPVPNVFTALSLRRGILLLYGYWIYFHSKKNTHAASESLRLIWMSLPDAFLTFEEISAVFKDDYGSLKVSDMYNFYKEALGISSSDVEPRSLQHYCRVAVRMSLWKAKHWIPEGITNCGLPSKLQSYCILTE